MFSALKNAFRTPELRKKILYTLLILLIFRIGNAITVPFLDVKQLGMAAEQISQSGFLGYLDILSGGAFSQGSILALSIGPYINASIIIQLLTVAITPLQNMAKEEDGRRKLNRITRYTTIGLAALQAFGYYTILRNQYQVLDKQYVDITKGVTGSEIFYAATIILIMMAGACAIIWLGDRIDAKGIGNGISMILFAGIVSRVPSVFHLFQNWWNAGMKGGDGGYKIFYIPFMIIFFGLMLYFIVYMNDAERRIPIQYAKRVVGRKVYGGQSQNFPIKVSMSGVMPMIFATSILSVPTMIASFIGEKNITPGWAVFFKLFDPSTSWLYAVLYFLLIIAFNYFYVFTQYDPVEIANNIRKNNGAIPGIRPGTPTATYIEKVIKRIVFIGAMFLSVVAILPILLSLITGENLSLGGTSILIVVSVALETMRALESQMMMRYYKGFMD